MAFKVTHTHPRPVPPTSVGCAPSAASVSSVFGMTPFSSSTVGNAATTECRKLMWRLVMSTGKANGGGSVMPAKTTTFGVPRRFSFFDSSTTFCTSFCDGISL